jgi:hypothetical protein
MVTEYVIKKNGRYMQVMFPSTYQWKNVKGRSRRATFDTLERAQRQQSKLGGEIVAVEVEVLNVSGVCI